ncbi:treslin isoform X2 [Dendrobates tinctorius]|uniref:treslin isoform X2 n=1 Tax=Dendrobates tinctorius TaxID=92724 RepID=UPI003CC98C64
MAESYNVVLLVDAADLGLKERVNLLSLRLLNFLTCRAGLGQVRWSYRFLNSLGGRCRPPRRSDLRELASRSWAEYQEELEACWQRARHSSSSSSGAPPAALTHTALMETLSDFQWDRPDITSPAKPAALRGRRGGRLRAAEEPPVSPSEMAAGSGSRSAVVVLSPCPHSREQLSHFTGGDTDRQHVMEQLLSRGLHRMVTHRRVALYWLDTADWAQMWQTCDHFGYWTMVEVMQHVGGKIIPSECLLESSFPQAAEYSSSRAPLNIPFDSVLSSLFTSELEYRSWFPQQDGVVTFMTADVKHWECAVTLEPISSTQNKLINNLMTVQLKGTVQNWNQNQVGPLTMESWLLHPSSVHSSCLHFNQLLDTTLSNGLFLVADVSLGEDSIPRTGILSPISENAACLNVICNYQSVDLIRLQHKTVKEIDEDVSDLPDIVNSVLSYVFNAKENTTSPEILMPEWINQELSQSSHWESSVIERWYPLSGMSGASGKLMESFRLISAASFDQDDQKSDQEMTHYLSELYQKKTDESVATLQGEYQNKRLPCTPVRQKMKSMPRALQMLNVARLNSKAQKLPPESAPAEKSSQVKRRSSDKPEGKAGMPAAFKSEEELHTYLIEDYDKMVSGEEDSLLSCVRNSFTTIKSFLKSASSNQIETDCLDKVRVLLKTSKMIRQLYGQNPHKVAKLRECQIQALLRLEICVQCPAIQTNEDELEQVVEEITDMLRIISLTEDPSYLTKFLAGVLTEYIGSIPKILADIYFSLGIQIPEELKSVLPADGDDSFILDRQTPMYSQPSISRVPSVPLAENEEDQLEKLRSRSAKKRRTSTMGRHRSIAESSQGLRQIELPKKPLKENSNTNLVVLVEKLKLPLPAHNQKDGEATKARRNLFVQENRSSTRRCSKMPRSQSVSTVEGLKHKRSKSHDGTTDHYKLLTKKVTETPAHKQMSSRLLYKQIKGRCRESPSNVSIVEESPQKDSGELEVRRSPRIKQLTMTRRNSSFYSSQPISRNLERVHSATQQTQIGGNATQPEAKTPKRLLFGEAYGLTSLPTRRARRKLLSETVPSTNEIFEKSKMSTPKNSQKSLPSCEQLNEANRLLRKSPRTLCVSVYTPKTPSKTSAEKKSAAKDLRVFFSPSKIEEKTPSKSAERRSERLAQTTPSRGSPSMCVISPLKSIRQQFTPCKEGADISQDEFLRSLQKTPSASADTAARVSHSTCTPREPPRLQMSSMRCVTPSRNLLQTPQKVSETPTPKQRLKHGADMLALAVECTPEKVTFFSPRKTPGIQSMIPCQPTIKTPRKFILNDDEPSCAQENSDPCQFICHSNSKPPKEAGGGQVKLESPSTSILEKPYNAARVMSPSINHPSIRKILSPGGKREPIVLCERLDMSSLESSEGTESFINSSQTDESIDITEAKVVPSESCDLKMKVLFKRKSSDAGLINHLPTTPKGGGDVTCTSPYGLRCTVDRRQREAAARLGTPQILAKFTTPKSQRKLSPPPVYEVELEMQASGLPKLRFKRTDSSSTVDLGTLPKSPTRTQSKKGNESPFGETWCNKHAMKLESACSSPCLRSSHNTPGKSGLQTLICHTYTPKRSSSSTASPSQAETVSPWTPSPKYKDKNGSDVINNWPRKKKAFPMKSHLLRQEKNPDYSCSAPSRDEGSQEPDVNKVSPFGDLIVDGVSRLLERSPVLEWKGRTDNGAMSFKSRKRSFDFMSPTKEEPNSKRSCTLSAPCEDLEECVPSSDMSLSQESSCEDDVFNIAAFTSPNKIVRNSLSTSGLLALTRSPMLFKGKTPLSKREKQDCDSQNSTPEVKTPDRNAINMEDSSFSHVSAKRPVSRTYTRKKLIT